MKKLILLFIICLVFSYCKKEKPHYIGTPKPQTPIDKSYHKGKYVGYYLNISDNTDTLFVYTPFDVNKDNDTSSFTGTSDPNLNLYSMYSKHLLEHLGSQWKCDSVQPNPYRYIRCGANVREIDLQSSQGASVNYSMLCSTSTYTAYASAPVTYYIDSTQHPYTAKMYFNYYQCNQANTTQFTYNYRKI